MQKAHGRIYRAETLLIKKLKFYGRMTKVGETDGRKKVDVVLARTTTCSRAIVVIAKEGDGGRGDCVEGAGEYI